MSSRYYRDTDDTPLDHYDGPLCIFCDEPATLNDYEPYCSESCAIRAELDSLEDQ